MGPYALCVLVPAIGSWAALQAGRSAEREAHDVAMPMGVMLPAILCLAGCGGDTTLTIPQIMTLLCF